MRLSIIVCTKDRSYAITECLDSIAQSLSAAAPVEAEIVVVDNASKDDTSAIIKKWATMCTFPVQTLYEAKKGVSAARNCAIRAARGELLVFTDDDCRLSKEYVREALHHDSADTEPILRGGRVELGDPEDLPLTIKIIPHQERYSLSMNSTRVENVANSIVGCNMAMRRAVARTIGFFDERLGPGTSIPASEDTDILFRAYLAGIVLEYVPDMIIYHYHGRKKIADGKKLMRNYALGNGAIFAKYFFKHPNFCRPFYWDAREAVKEIIYGKNTFLPHIDLGHKEWVTNCIKGMIDYWTMLIKNKIATLKKY